MNFKIGNAISGDLYAGSLGWWLAEEGGDGIWMMVNNELTSMDPEVSGEAIRPLIKLSSEATGSVGTTVTIDK